MTISDEDITISMKSRGKIAILEAKRQSIINIAENQINNKRDAIQQIEAQRVSDLALIDARIQIEKDKISSLIGNV